MDKNKIIQSATKYVQRGQLDKAIAEYQKARRADPKDVRILLKIGELQQKKGDKEQAANTLLDVAKAYAADGFFLKAVAVYKQIVKLDPSRVSVNVELAELYQQLGLNSDAMGQLEVVANHYEREGNAGEALNTLRRMVDLDPDNVTSRIKLGELFAQQGKTAEALRELRVSAEHLKSYNRMDDYLRVAERVCLLAPEDVGLSLELAGLFLSRRDPRRALSRLQVCFNANPRDPATLGLLARAFHELGQVPKAVAVYKELARIHREAGDGDQERQAWRKVLELSADDAEAIESFSRGPAAAARAPVAAAIPAGDAAGRAAVPPGARPGAAQSGHSQAGHSQAGARSAGTSAPVAGAGVDPGSGGGRGAGDVASAARDGRAAAAPAAPVARAAAAQPAEKRAQVAAGAGAEQLPKLLTEVDVYIKYGLFEKANAHLQVVRSLAPDSIEGLERAIQLHAAQENVAAQQAAMVELLRACLAQGQLERGRDHLHALIDVAPNHPELQELLSAYAGGEVEAEVPAAEASVVLDIDEAELEVEADEAPAGPQQGIGVEELQARRVMDETAGPSFLDLPEGDEALFATDPGSDEPIFQTGAGEDEAIVAAALEGDEELIASEAIGDDELFVASDEDDELLLGAPLGDDELLAAETGADDEELVAGSADLEEPTDDEFLLVGEEDEAVVAGFDDDDELLLGGSDADDELLLSLPPTDDEVLARPEEIALDVALLVGGAPTPVEEGSPTGDEPLLVGEVADDEAEVFSVGTSVEDSLGPVGGAVLGDSTAAWRDVEEARKAELEFRRVTADDDEVVDDELVEAELGFEASSPGVGENSEIEVELTEGQFFLANGYLGEAEDRFRSVLRRQPGNEVALRLLGEAESRAEARARRQESGEAPEVADPEEVAAEEAIDLERTVVQMPSAADLAEIMARPPAASEEAAAETLAAETLAAEAAAAAAEAAALKAAAEEAAAVEAASATNLRKIQGPVDEEPFDLGIELANELVAINADPDPVQEFQYSVDDVLAEFKKGVSQTVSAEDTETHYDLGIAYKEMGLLTDAIAEFEIARKGSVGQKKEIDCLTMGGMCEALLGNHEAAIASFLRALGLSAVTPEAAMALHFEIGLSYEAMGDRDEALDHFGKVARIDPTYRKVEQTIRNLEAAPIPPKPPRQQEGMGKV